MKDDMKVNDLEEYVPLKEAAKMLGLAYTTAHKYVTEGRIPSKRVSDIILISVAEIKKFKPNLSGRPRKNIPQWRISPDDNTLLQTSILVQIRESKRKEFFRRLEKIRRDKKHLFPGTVSRYISGKDRLPGLVEISLIWRSSVMPEEADRNQALEAFREDLADVLDWDTAQYDTGEVFMHT